MRKHKAELRPRVADPKYNDTLVSQFINSLMLQGRKSIAQRIMYDALDIAQERTGQPGLEIFKKAMTNSSPSLVR